ncbi:twin-arginine translocase subunit TatC [Motilimonas eburnea]|uniref:twin-arginine translocase subunit TatC n=1 Tax=Motilimonas eburnea TaxID=1737488 RepID=UPI001E3702B9|nr:twin-arginine translocase subunit TatC [Motilimonas eburnea]MCE2571084.1 twin-arginine translocase subunit TatC [Motilimonas eburnea]
MSEPLPEHSAAPLISHLMELRNRLLRAVIAVALIFAGLVYFANEIYYFVAEPLTSHLPEGASMIATDVATPFFTPIKLTIVLSVFLAMPYLLYQAWGFIAPGLYQHEKRLIAPLVFFSALLFYGGIAFAYYVVFPLVFQFFTSVAPEGVTIATDISSYLDFVLKLFFAFGLAFEIPIATLLLCWTGATTPAQLKAKRPYIVVAAFVIGMLLTPPDIISQTMLAIPMLLLFELGLLFSRFYVKKNEDEQEATD